ncbi:Fic family protein [Actinomadura scrupuli]|uniref:Fic family protein n=1 Tax=Actinomadura scrupuli TaxID=559629 RepID=UPI003D98ACB0
MLYATPSLAGDDQRVLGEIEEMRRELRFQLAERHRWDGQLRRHLQARAIQGSNSIEGYRAGVEDIESIMAGEAPLETGDAVAREIAGYQQAMTYVRQLATTPHFGYDVGLIHALNFMIIGHHLNKSPGAPRPGAVFVRNNATGEVVYEGPDADQVPALLDELVAWLNDGDLDVPVYVRAAMAHFNLVSIHPWRDGNGRMSRALQTLVIGREQILTPEFCSIEEWLGIAENTVDYYRVLRDVGQGRWTPTGDAQPWVRFCLRAHHLQAQQVRRRLKDAGQVWMLLEEQVDAEGLPPRTVAALYQVFVSRRVRRGTYQSDEALSHGQAARDLRELVKHDWLTPYGETKGRFYAPGRKMMRIREDFAARITPLRDPYKKAGSVRSRSARS